MHRYYYLLPITVVDDAKITKATHHAILVAAIASYLPGLLALDYRVSPTSRFVRTNCACAKSHTHNIILINTKGARGNMKITYIICIDNIIIMIAKLSFLKVVSIYTTASFST